MTCGRNGFTSWRTSLHDLSLPTLRAMLDPLRGDLPSLSTSHKLEARRDAWRLRFTRAWKHHGILIVNHFHKMEKTSFGGIPNCRNVLFYIFFSKPPPGPSLQPSPEPSPEPCWTWLGVAPRLPGTFSGTFSGTLLRNLLQNLVEPSWTKASWSLLRKPSPEPCWTWPGSASPTTFSGTFSGTLLNLSCLRTKDLLRNLRNLLRNLVEPDPAPAPVHTGAILGWRPH